MPPLPIDAVLPEALAGPTISISGGGLGKGGAKKGGLPIVS